MAGAATWYSYTVSKTRPGAEDSAVTDAVSQRPAHGIATDRVGVFRFDNASRVLWWSDSLYEIYGYAPGSVVPSTELIIELCHPDDRSRAEGILASVLATGRGCVHAHRIVTTGNELRHIVIVGNAVRDSVGVVTGFTGYTVDVTRRTELVVAEGVNEAIGSAVEARAVIEQAKGALMLAFGVDAETAFGVLSWQSQLHNVKLRLLAEQIMMDVHSRCPLSAEVQDNIGNLVLTAHERLH